MNTPDPTSVAIQQEILAALRAGAEFSTAHKEGGTVIRWKSGRYIRADFGDWSEYAEYADDARFLSFLRQFFDWQSRGQGVPEPERWRKIQQQLQAGRSSGTHGQPVSASGGRSARVMRTVVAFVIAAVAVTLVFWMRGRLPGYHEQPPQRLDTVKGTPDFPSRSR